MIEKQLMKIINKKNLELSVKFIFSKKASKIKISKHNWEIWSNFCALSRKQETCSCRPDFRPWDVMTKVRYFLMVQIDNLRTLEVEHDLETCQRP